MAEAVAEKDHPELWQRENCEKWLADSVDCHIKRWSAGKEGNLRAFLSSLQDVLWPECKWDPVSLADLISPTSVKKVYARARIRVHANRIQAMEATLEHKYIAEKVCDILKEIIHAVKIRLLKQDPSKIKGSVEEVYF